MDFISGLDGRSGSHISEISLADQIAALRAAGMPESRIREMLLRRWQELDYGVPLEVRACDVRLN